MINKKGETEYRNGREQQMEREYWMEASVTGQEV
jgi:hypothetical protein